MKKLIHAVALTLTIASFSSAAYGTTTIKNSGFPDVVGAVQFPQNKAKVVRDSFKLEIPQDSRALSQMTIAVPKGVTVRNDIELSNQSGQKIAANITVNGRTITIVFPQQVAPGTKLNIDLNRVLISGTSNAWLYPVSVRLVGMNADIPIGVFRLRIY
ncbi:DUF2808 domain-containing protein [Anabaena cylindrica UHCC 0172]|uniref:DUF2808 domain-containing protein n=1 Tax=Anabaena cylindrica TaxID=1165 RepID=UPI002B203513|nr:DUF2808 domain-containing protein [Anabaena cylindrica]MEA5552041.1 DUF2808 domain-containing protein [Anabaena cylindrica UHCC 0172]